MITKTGSYLAFGMIKQAGVWDNIKDWASFKEFRDNRKRKIFADAFIDTIDTAKKRIPPELLNHPAVKEILHSGKNQLRTAREIANSKMWGGLGKSLGFYGGAGALATGLGYGGYKAYKHFNPSPDDYE